MIICAFYTGNHYEKCGDFLIRDCEKFGYKYDISEPDSLLEFINDKPEKKAITMRNWICRYKPQFIREMLEKYDESVLYLDVDARIRKKIKIPKGIKIGICHQPHNKDVNIIEVLASCLYFNSIKSAKDFLYLYEYKCVNIPSNAADHWFLKTTVADYFRCSGLIKYMDMGWTVASKKIITDPMILHNARKYR